MGLARVVASLIVAVAACADRTDDPTHANDRHLPTTAERAAAPPSSAERMFAPEPAPPDAGPASPVHLSSQLETHWFRADFPDDCFFFSGPDGRDDRLTGPASIERDGEAVSITINHAVFVGTFKNNELFAGRKSNHNYHGAWTITESLYGHYRDGTMTADYHYLECGPDGVCPSRCTIDGTLKFQR
jgi:hypothetical protein